MEVTVEDMEEVMKQGLKDDEIRYEGAAHLPAEDLTGKFNAFNIGVSEKSPEDKKKERRVRNRKASSASSSSNRAAEQPANAAKTGPGIQGGSLADR
jgi:hypothetical protein